MVEGSTIPDTILFIGCLCDEGLMDESTAIVWIVVFVALWGGLLVYFNQ